MATNEYAWGDLSAPPQLRDHSLAKHSILKEYLTRYVKALTTTPGQTLFKLDIVDGFSGGGLYKSPTGEFSIGSPIISIEAVNEAIAEINTTRKNKIIATGDRIFIDKDKLAIDMLKAVLRHRNHDINNPNQQIHFLTGEFKFYLTRILENLKTSKNKVIFILDQYGYSQATSKEINSIFTTLKNRAEVLITISTDKLISYLSDNPAIKSAIINANLQDVITDTVIEEFRDAPQHLRKHTRVVIQYLVGQKIFQESGAQWNNCLFIRSNESDRAYLFMHLSNNIRARDEMNKVLWAHQNNLVHDAGAGIRMFEYVPIKEIQLGLEFNYTSDDRSTVHETLVEQLRHYLTDLKQAISFEQLQKDLVNTSTPAGTVHFQDALFQILTENDITIKTKKDGTRRVANTIHKEDVISISAQKQYVFNFK